MLTPMLTSLAWCSPRGPSTCVLRRVWRLTSGSRSSGGRWWVGSRAAGQSIINSQWSATDSVNVSVADQERSLTFLRSTWAGGRLFFLEYLQYLLYCVLCSKMCSFQVSKRIELGDLDQLRLEHRRRLIAEGHGGDLEVGGLGVFGHYLYILIYYC